MQYHGNVAMRYEMTPTSSQTAKDNDPSACEDLEVDASELQRPPNQAAETNPVSKVEGVVAFDLHRADAAGLGQILSEFGDL